MKLSPFIGLAGETAIETVAARAAVGVHGVATSEAVTRQNGTRRRAIAGVTELFIFLAPRYFVIFLVLAEVLDTVAYPDNDPVTRTVNRFPLSARTSL